MAKKKVTKKKATKTRTRRTATPSRATTKSRTAPLFPAKLIIEWDDGTSQEMVFADPTSSTKGNLNAWAGNKLVRNGKMLRVNCNVTQVRG